MARWVVKLGGSLIESPHLDQWLAVLADSGVIIVPGGGPFADQVRITQQRLAFDDATAHAMALLAMAQYGLLLKTRCPALQVEDRLERLLRRSSTGRSVIWLPGLELLDQADIPQTWAVTADSLAAWLAGHLAIDRLLLVKSASAAALSPGLADLSRAGVVDPALESFALRSGLSVWLSPASGHAGWRTLRQGFSPCLQYARRADTGCDPCDRPEPGRG